MQTQNKANKFIIGGLVALAGIAIVVGLFAVFNQNKDQAVVSMPPQPTTGPRRHGKPAPLKSRA